MHNKSRPTATKSYSQRGDDPAGGGLRSTVVVVAGWIGLLCLVGAPLTAAEPDDEEEIVCMTFLGCGGIIIQDELDIVQEAEDLERLATQLLIDPVAPPQVWFSFLSLLEEKERSEEQFSNYYRAIHWQDKSPEPPAGGLDRLGWIDHWRRHNPRQSEAWCSWARLAAETWGDAAVIAEMESSWAIDPTNPAVHSCLMGALKRAGSTARFQELLEVETATDPDLAERYHYLPEELRRRYAFEAMSYDSEKIQMEILEQARQQRPDDPYLEIESLKLEARQAGDERQAEIKARLEAISEGDHTLVDRAALCAAIEDLDFAPAEDCRQRFSEQVAEAGLHLSPFRVPDEARKLEDENWHSLIFEVRSNLVEKAVAGRDLAALETILIDGPGFGYGQLWGLALDLTETDDEQAEQAEQARELKALHQGLCARLGKATQDGSLDRPIYRALHVCPGRAESIADLLADCELEAEQRRLTQIISSRLSDLPDYYLRTGDAPVGARIDEVKRRLSTRELTPTELELLEDVLTDLLVGARDTAGLIEVGHRRVARFGDLNAEMRHWLERVRGVEGVEVEVLTDLLPVRPEDRLLRLRIAGERLRQAPRDLVEAQQLSQEVLRSRRASVRERAEANYLLGRVAVLEGRLEDATPLLAEFYETWIEHRACPAGLRGCDRDFPLHLIAIGDWPRLEAYQQRRSQELAEQVEQPSARMRYGLLHEDPAFKWLFLDDGCGLASALPHVEALAAERPDDPAVQARLLLERRRTCLRREGPYPWSQETQPMAGTFVDRESHLLLSDDYP